jgi:hypothetical protein
MRGYAQGWVEQRSWVARAIDSLATMAASGDHSARWLHTNAHRRVNETRARGAMQEPDLTGFDNVPLSSGGQVTPIPCTLSGLRVSVNSSGAIVLATSIGTPLGEVGQYVYNTLNGSDISRFMQEYLVVQREQAFGKINVDAVAHPVSGHWLPSLYSAHVRSGKANARQTSGGSHGHINGPVCTIWTRQTMAPWLVTEYGAAAIMWQRLDVSINGE